MAEVALDAVKKIAISFAVVFIVASIFSELGPGMSEKALAFFEEKLGFGEPSIGSFTATFSGDNANIKYSILGNYRDVKKILVYNKAAIPPQLGEPDKDGIYKYVAAEATPLYYRFKEDSKSWEWSPDKKNWMPVSETTVRAGSYKGQRLAEENIAIINYLNSANPDPKGIGEAYPDNPSLTSNVVASLQDATPKGTITGDAGELFNNAWHRFTIELYISNGDIASEEVEIRVGVPIEFGYPDSQGVYTYQAPGAKPMYYRFKDNAWQWTPYYPAWMQATTTTVSNPYQTDKQYDGQQPKWDGGLASQAHRAVINYLALHNPSPTSTKTGVPQNFGLPDSSGVYKYCTGLSCIYYRYVGGGWQWTPYEPKENIWMPVTTTYINSPGKKYHGDQPSTAHREMINYMAANNPGPVPVVPPTLGAPNNEGIYATKATIASTPMFYRYVNGGWQWTPYYPVWMRATTTPVVNNPYEPTHKWSGRPPEQGNVDVIMYLATANPKP